MLYKCFVFAGLPVERGYCVHGFERLARGHHITAARAITLHVHGGVWLTILYHHNQTRPAVCQVVCSHPLSALKHK